MKPAQAESLLLELRAAMIGDGAADWADIDARLSSLTGPEWLLLDQLARRSTWARPALMFGVPDRLGVDDADGSPVVATALALHVDGRIRERAVRQLGALRGGTASSVLGLRLLDHVPQVRDRARYALATQGNQADHSAVLDVVLAGRGRLHGDEQLSWLIDEWQWGETDLAALRRSHRRAVRRWATEQAHARGLLTPQDVVNCADSDQDQWLRRRAAEWLMSTPEPSHLVPLLDSRSVEARLTAVTRVPDELLDDATLEGLVLDKAPRVREQAQWRARRRDMDVALVCRRHLADNSVRHVAGALDGLARVGSRQDVDVIGHLLHDHRPRVRAAAVRAVAALTADEEAVQLLIDLLEDPSGRVSSAAAVALARAGAPADVAENAWLSTTPNSRKAAWRLAREAGAWSRVAADLRASADSDPGLARLGRDGVRGWLVAGAATTWGHPSEDLGRRMRGWVGESGLHDHERRQVLFHAGLAEPHWQALPKVEGHHRARSIIPGWLRRRP